VLRNSVKLSEPHAESLSSSGSEFQTDESAIEIATATAVCVESTARYDELVSVCRTQTKPRSDVRGCDEMVGEVSRCLTLKITDGCGRTDGMQDTNHTTSVGRCKWSSGIVIHLVTFTTPFQISPGSFASSLQQAVC